jgi:hypothetical protein
VLLDPSRIFKSHLLISVRWNALSFADHLADLEGILWLSRGQRPGLDRCSILLPQSQYSDLGFPRFDTDVLDRGTIPSVRDDVDPRSCLHERS